MDYDLMEKENLPEVLEVKPKWVSFLVITLGVLAMITCAVTIGTIFGYTYCYIEHHCIKPVTYTPHHSNLQIVWPREDSAEARYNRTINGAIMSSVLVSKIMKTVWPHASLNDIVGLSDPGVLLNGTARQTNELGLLLKDTADQAKSGSMLRDTEGQVRPDLNDIKTGQH